MISSCQEAAKAWQVYEWRWCGRSVQPHHSASKAVTVVRNVLEQGRGVGSNSLCFQPRSHQVWQWMSQGETMKDPNKNFSFSKSHNLGKKKKKKGGFNKAK